VLYATNNQITKETGEHMTQISFLKRYVIPLVCAQNQKPYTARSLSRQSPTIKPDKSKPIYGWNPHKRAKDNMVNPVHLAHIAEQSSELALANT
jgi:hypothetical protein